VPGGVERRAETPGRRHQLQLVADASVSICEPENTAVRDPLHRDPQVSRWRAAQIE